MSDGAGTNGIKAKSETIKADDGAGESIAGGQSTMMKS